MDRRNFIKTSSLALLAASNKKVLAQPADTKINILFLMDDQHRGDCLGCEGQMPVRTPHLDRLASEGIRFTRAYTSAPSCLPARAALLTGMSPWGHGMLLYTPLPERYAYEKPRVFTEAGYRTHAVGKMHFDSHPHGYESVLLEEGWRGRDGRDFQCDYRKFFATHCPEGDVDATGLGYVDHRGGRPFLYDDALHPTHWTAQQAVDFLEGYDGDRPWFLKVSFQRPHPPFDPPKRLLEAYQKQDLPNAQVGAWAEAKYGAKTGTVEETPNAPLGHYPEEDIHAARAAYFAAITFVDEQVGLIMAALNRRGELENTLILFTADHGDMMGDQHMWRKTYAYEPSARIPMIVRWPEALRNCGDATRGQVSDQLVELRDVLPTFLDAAGLAIPEHLEGRTMLDIVRGTDGDWRKELDLEHGTCYWPESAWVALTDARYKYIYFTYTGEQQLFDLQADPRELQDLAPDDQHADLLQSWRKRMYAHLEKRGAPWVQGGDLGTFQEPIKHGPNFPVQTA